jgi:two-component system, LytTR family, sensor kinase
VDAIPAAAAAAPAHDVAGVSAGARPTLLKPFPRLSWRRNVGWLALGAAAFALLSAVYKYLEVVVSGGSRYFAYPLLEELTGAASAVLLAPLVIGAARRWPVLERRGWRWLPIHAAAMLGFGVLSTSFMWLSRSAVWPLLGLGAYDYGMMPLRYLMELPKQAIIFGLILVLTTLLDRHDAARRRELRLIRTEAALAQAQLGALHAQLRPHFLFNALNTISSVMYEDTARADRMMSLLSDLLRWSLSSSAAGEVPLHAELEATGKYLELMRARMGPRLCSTIVVEPGAEAAMVPALLLQPLVENAASHGIPDPPAQGRIEVRVSRDGEELVLLVSDNGPGPAGGAAAGAGVGLSNTSARLRAMYGSAGGLELRDGTGGGAVVEVRLPYRPAGARAEGAEERWTGSV